MEMVDSAQSEERYPLLFLFLDDGNKTARKNKNVFFERGRGQGIMSGATAVLTQWPAHLSSCGLMTVVLTMTVFFFLLMLLASTFKPAPSSLHPRCLRKSYEYMDTSLFLVHDDYPWQQNQLDILEEILMKYHQCEVELLILRDHGLQTEKGQHGFVDYNQPPSSRLKRHIEHKKKRYVIPKNKTADKWDLNINIGAKNLLKAFLERRRHLNGTSTAALTSTTTTTVPSLPNLDDVLVKFPKLIIKNMSTKDVFENGPLYGVWRNFNKKTLNFAARVLKLWENGGISFEIPYLEESKNITNSTEYYRYEVVAENATTISTATMSTTKILDMIISPAEENKLIKNMINLGYSTFRNLPEGLVTVDEEGIHMETKTTCHAFFGEALVQLKHANNETTVPEVIRNTLKTFCVRGAVDSEYCNSI